MQARDASGTDMGSGYTSLGICRGVQAARLLVKNDKQEKEIFDYLDQVADCEGWEA